MRRVRPTMSPQRVSVTLLASLALLFVASLQFSSLPASAGPASDFYASTVGTQTSGCTQQGTNACATLQEALNAAIASTNTTTTVHVASGTYVENDSFTLSNSRSINIVGDSASTTFLQGTTTTSESALTMLGGNVSIDGMTIEGGDFAGTASIYGDGGGVFNDSTLTMGHDALINNSAQFGGGLYNVLGATANLENDTFSNNTTNDLGHGAQGGGVFNAGTITLENDTFFGNTAENGGALQNNGTATLVNDTFASDSASSTNSGDEISNTGTLSISNSILSSSLSCANSGTITDNGYSVEADDSCGLSSSGTNAVNNAAINLASTLALNGSTGPKSLAIGTGSAAYQEVPSLHCVLDTDELGNARPGSGSACDAGAFEYEASSPPFNVGDDPTTCLFTPSNVYDTQFYNTGSIPSETLHLSSLNYPVYTTTVNPYAYDRLGASDESNGNYFGFINLGGGNFKLNLYYANGSVDRVMDTTGQFVWSGTGYLFYLGDGYAGTLFTTNNTYQNGDDVDLNVLVDNPTLSQVDQAFQCPMGFASTPTISNIPSSNSYGDSFTASLSTNGDGTPSVTSSTSSVCTVGNDGLTVTFVGVGACDLTAHVATGAIYAAADGTQQAITVHSATASTPSISNIPSNALVQGSFQSTVTTNGDGATSVTSTTPSVCTVGSDNLTVSFIASGQCTLTAHVGTGTNYNAADGQAQSFTVGKVAPTAPTISNVPNGAVYGGSLTAVVTTNGDGTKTVTSLTSGVCSATGLSVSFIGAGTCTLEALVASGNNYLSADGTAQSFSVSKAPAVTPTISNIPSAATFGGTFTATVSTNSDGVASVTSNTPSVCTTSGLNVSYVGAGSCILVATVTQGADFLPSTGPSQGFAVTQKAPNVPVISDLPSNALFGGNFAATIDTNGDGTTSVTSQTPATCSASGLAVSFVGAGTCTLTAVVSSGKNYAGATGTPQSFAIGKIVPAAPVITNLPSQPFTGGSFGANVSTTSTGSASVTSLTPSVCSAGGLSVQFVGVGTCTLEAQVAASANDASSQGSPQSFSVVAVPVTTTTTTTTTSTSTTTTTTPSTTTSTSTTLATTPVTPTVVVVFLSPPGAPISQTQVLVQGSGLEPGATVTIVAHSSPTQLASSSVGPGGTFNLVEGLPSNLPVGVHHIAVTSTSANGTTYHQVKTFTVAPGGRLGAVGYVPPGPLKNDIQYVPTVHRSAVLVTTAGGVAALAAVGSGLGGGFGGSTLSDIELNREEVEIEEDREEKFRTWRWPGTGLLDRLSKHLPHRLAKFSPVVGRVLVDGDYLRAMFGSAWLLLCSFAIAIGLLVSSSTGWYATPPSLGLFLLVLGVGVFDSTLGFLAGMSFIVGALFAGHLGSANEVRLAMGLALVWFAVPLAAAALRPLRRRVTLDREGLWERFSDLLISGLFGAWVCEKMVGSLSGLAGVELPIVRDVNVIALWALGFVAARIVVETFAAHFYPKRIGAVKHEGALASSTRQIALSLLLQVSVFIFIAIAFLGSTWALYLGAVLFFTPLAGWLVADKLPKSATLAKWRPKGVLMWTVIIITGILISRLLDHVIPNSHLVEEVGFVVLPLPVLIFWAIELFEGDPALDDGANEGRSRAAHEERQDEQLAERQGEATSDLLEAALTKSGESKQRREVVKWAGRLLDLGLLATCVYLVVAHIAGGG